MKSGYSKIVQTLQTSFVLIFVSLSPLSGLSQKQVHGRRRYLAADPTSSLQLTTE